MSSKSNLVRGIVVASVGFTLTHAMSAEPFTPNYDESKVPPYSLPDPLVMANGRKVADAKTWQTKRRTEILELFRTHVYGRSPDRPRQMKFTVTSLDRQALGGTATRKEVSVCFTAKPDGPKMDLLIYLPNAARKPVPAFLGMNFEGNHTIQLELQSGKLAEITVNGHSLGRPGDANTRYAALFKPDSFRRSPSGNSP